MPRKTWTLEKIREGFDRFRASHARLPTALEVDHERYLPSSRWIQLKFGGLEKLRAKLGYSETHFGKGSFRSDIARRVNRRGRSAEVALETILRDRFGEVFVHTEKIFDSSKNRVDFYVYSPDGNFGADIFSSDSMRTLRSSVNIKMNKYKNFWEELYLLFANDISTQGQLDAYAHSKTKPLAKNVRLVTQKSFLNFIKHKRAYPNPLK